ncbi:MAG: hypothetical protein Q9O62_13165 [Ardenticatenia bacterium]|nr:hypothetical protein [Ardenticatenia bacterium]
MRATIGAIVTVLVVACGVPAAPSPTATPAPTATPLPTSTPAPTLTPVPDPLAQALAERGLQLAPTTLEAL